MRFSSSAASLVALAVLAGCAHADSAADRHALEMRDAIGKVQVEQDRYNRGFDLGDDVPANEKLASDKVAEPKPGAGVPARPVPLRTVQIGDDADARESDDPNDPAQRPEIRVQGPAGAASRGSVRSKTSRHDDDPSRPSILDPDAKKSYDAALALVHAHQYDRALDALAGFLVKWPDHPYAENALYWRGESFFARGEYLRAAEQFEAVLARFGGANKAPDSLLKIGLCHERLGAAERAKEYWDRLRREHPRSDAAKKIPVPATAKENR